MTKKVKSPYIGYNVDEVLRIESNFYTLEMGGDFVAEDQYHLFSKIEVIKIYNKTLKDLLGIIAEGTDKDRKYAIELIGKLVVKPMRLH